MVATAVIAGAARTPALEAFAPARLVVAGPEPPLEGPSLLGGSPGSPGVAGPYGSSPGSGFWPPRGGGSYSSGWPGTAPPANAGTAPARQTATSTTVMRPTRTPLRLNTRFPLGFFYGRRRSYERSSFPAPFGQLAPPSASASHATVTGARPRWPLERERAIGLRSSAIPAPGVFQTAAHGQQGYSLGGRRHRKPLVQGVPCSLLSLTRRGTQDSNLESPVLETGAFRTR